MQEELLDDFKNLLNKLNLPEDSGTSAIITAIGSMSQAIERFRDIAIAADKRADEVERKLQEMNDKIIALIKKLGGDV